MPDEVPLVSPTLDVVEEIAETTAEPVIEAASAVEDAAVDTIGELSSALTIQADRLDAQQTTLGTVVSMLNQMNETLAGIAQSAIQATSDVIEEVAEVPEETVETVEAVIEGDSTPPANRKKRMMGRKRRK